MAADREVNVPDIGDFEDVDVIEVLVAPGDRVEHEQSLITLESDKATMEIPSPAAGVVKQVLVAVGDKVSEGTPIVVLETVDEAASSAEAQPPSPSEKKTPEATPKEDAQAASDAEASPAAAAPGEDSRPKAEAPAPTEAGPAQMLTEAPPLDHRPAPSAHKVHASPSLRRLAREFGVELARVQGTGRKGRILKEDVQGFVKQALATSSLPSAPAGFAVPEMPEIDFSRWGEIELQPLNKLRRVSARNVHRAWLTVPHVTQFDEADITELEAFRREKQPEAKQRGVKLTPLGFFLKASAVTLLDFPNFNASLDRSGEALVIKKYVHIGIAVDTEHGLVVPVIRDVDEKGLFELSEELSTLSQKARDRKLRPDDLQGGTFSISSLGGIGGTAFTPIVNAPEVAILGVARAATRPVWNADSEQFEPRLVVPLCLSYDHRVIDGADAARFTTRLKTVLSDIRNLIL
jgi:pyruvate dehydrogenase E2 component (dihydrolipoamide acetyltransferase)